MKLLKGCVVVLLCFIVESIGFSYAQNLDVMNLPKMNAPVVDYSNTLTQSQLQELNMLAGGLESGHQGAQVVTVIIPDRQGYELFDIGMKIAKDNAIGSAEYDNGLLLVIASNEKKIRIMVGYGLEGVVPDILARRIIENDIRPLVNQGDMYGAVQAWYRVIPQYLVEGSAQEVLRASSWLETLGVFAVMLAFGLVAWGGYLGSKAGDYLNGKETTVQLKELKTKSGFFSYSWVLGFLMIFFGVTMGLIAWAVASMIVGFVLGLIGAYTRVISPNFWQSVKTTMYRDRGRGGRSGGSGGWGGGGFGGGGRSGGGGSFGGGGAGD